MNEASDVLMRFIGTDKFNNIIVCCNFGCEIINIYNLSDYKKEKNNPKIKYKDIDIRIKSVDVYRDL